MGDNLKLWSSFSRPPKEALKTISAGRLKGKSDINPQWRMKAMTEQFGPIGDGWGYEIKRLWTEPGLEGQVFAFAEIALWVGPKCDINVIPGIGGSMLLEKQSSGMHHNDEAYKMAVTDALSVAMKALGVAADIYMGLWDGSKYKEPIKEASPNGTATPTTGARERLSEQTIHRLEGIVEEVKSLLKQGKSAEANKLIEDEKIKEDADIYVAFWTYFDSKERGMLDNAPNMEDKDIEIADRLSKAANMADLVSVMNGLSGEEQAKHRPYFNKLKQQFQKVA